MIIIFLSLCQNHIKYVICYKNEVILGFVQAIVHFMFSRIFVVANLNGVDSFVTESTYNSMD